jgi:hypothetical protein
MNAQGLIDTARMLVAGDKGLGRNPPKLAVLARSGARERGQVQTGSEDLADERPHEWRLTPQGSLRSKPDKVRLSGMQPTLGDLGVQSRRLDDFLAALKDKYS